MQEELKLARDLIDFIYDSPSKFHVVENVKSILVKNGFEELDIRDRWVIKKGKSYFVSKNNSALIAFRAGFGEIQKDGFRMIGAHTDSPTFSIKPNPEIVSSGSYLKLNTEVYGLPIINTWMDRPLSIAGRISIKSSNTFYPETKLVNIKNPVLVIPNLAIHMNLEMNKGVDLNPQKDTLPLLAKINSDLQKDNYLVKMVSQSSGVDLNDILDFDLFLYEYDKGTIAGANNEFISCGRLDDLSMLHAGITALINIKPAASTNVMVCFDNEEVGSMTKQGADSPMLRTVLERIALSLGCDREDFFRALYSSFIISADDAHSIHPNVPEKCDPVNRPMINGGPAIKIIARQSYTSDSDSCAVYEQICKKAGVPVQKFVNRSDEKGGSTIGPISSSQLDIRSVDIGNPILSMHSIRELGGVSDQYYVQKSFEEFYKYEQTKTK